MGSAVGTICAPNYAIIPIGEFERTYICPYIRSFVNSYCRIIDDLFLLWSGRQTFMKRGYQDQFFDRQFERLSTKERKSLLTQKPNNSSTNRIPLEFLLY